MIGSPVPRNRPGAAERASAGLNRVQSPIEVNRGSGEPLYRQLRRALEHQILSGHRPVELPLPSTRALAQELGLSRNTVSGAYEELLASGLIEGRSRLGFFINESMVRSIRADAGPTPAPAASRPGTGHPAAGEERRPDPRPARGPGLAAPAAPDGASDQSGGPAATGSGAEAAEPVWRRHLRNTRGEQPPEITKPLGWETQPYPFVAGQIDEREFPRLPWARALREALEPPHLFYSVRDAIDADDPELVRAIVRHVLPARGVQAEPENVLVTTGSQQGLDLLAHALSGPGSTVGVEDPGYVDARHTFLRAGARLRPFPVDGEGIVLPPSGLGVDLLYLTPSHQSPTNVTLSRPRRLDILERARASGTVVIEDDYDSEFRYQGQPSPALRAHPGAEHVIYLGSFTKFLAPGLRLGYLIADAALIRELRRLRRYRVRHLPGHSQRAMALLISSGHYQRTITRRRGALGQKWEMLRTVLGEELPWSFPVPPGGVSVWVSGPPGFDGVALTERARAHGIVIERGDVFFTRPEENRNHIRLGFAAIDLARIRPGVRRLASLIR